MRSGPYYFFHTYTASSLKPIALASAVPIIAAAPFFAQDVGVTKVLDRKILDLPLMTLPLVDSPRSKLDPSLTLSVPSYEPMLHFFLIFEGTTVENDN